MLVPNLGHCFCGSVTLQLVWTALHVHVLLHALAISEKAAVTKQIGRLKADNRRLEETIHKQNRYHTPLLQLSALWPREYELVQWSLAGGARQMLPPLRSMPCLVLPSPEAGVSDTSVLEWLARDSGPQSDMCIT